VLTGNDIRCNPRTGFSVGPAAPGTMISGNAVAGARMGILVRNSGAVQLDNNRIVGATVFGITVRGLPSKVAGVGNVLSGTGFRAVDARADADPPALSGTNSSGWAHHARVTFWSYLRFHPLAALWLSIAILVLAGAAWSHRRRLPPHPYPASTRWRGSMLDSLPEHMASAQETAHGSAKAPAAAGPATNGHPARSRTTVTADHTAPMPALTGATLVSVPGGTQESGRMVPPWAPSAEPAQPFYNHESDFDVFSPPPKAADQS